MESDLRICRRTTNRINRTTNLRESERRLFQFDNRPSGPDVGPNFPLTPNRLNHYPLAYAR